jgi:hypothetical protein
MKSGLEIMVKAKDVNMLLLHNGSKVASVSYIYHELDDILAMSRELRDMVLIKDGGEVSHFVNHIRQAAAALAIDHPITFERETKDYAIYVEKHYK